MDNVMDVCSQQRQLEEGVSAAGTSEAEALLDANSEDEAQLQIQVTPPATSFGGQGGNNVQQQLMATPSQRPEAKLIRDSTYIAINKFRQAERVAPNLMGGDMINSGDCGSLYCEDDMRHVLCFTRFDFGLKQCIMYSFDPAAMECSCCAGKVLYKKSPDTQVKPRTIVLSDQNFPACLPVKQGDSKLCMKIIRVEFGSLWELCNVYMDLIRSKDLVVPMGSAILLGSASHLSNVGISAYAEELVAVCRKLFSLHNGEIYILPCPFIMCWGSDDPEFVRATTELVSWLGNILSKEVFYTPMAMELSARVILESELPPASAPTRRLLLPVSLSCPLKKKWACGASNLPVGAVAAGEMKEREIITTLIGELNARLSLDLGVEVSFQRQVAAPAARPETIVVIGASHASRLATALEAAGATVVRVCEPGWRVTKTKVVNMVEKLKAELDAAGEDCTVVYQMLDNNYYFARTEEGGLVPICKRQLDNSYHVDGELAFAPKEIQYSTFCTARPLFELAGSRRKVVVTPIPRYLKRGCCGDADHVSNINSSSYAEDQKEAVGECRKNIRDFCFRQGVRNVKVVGPWKDLAEMGDSVWHDQVHLSGSGYQEIARLILQAVAELSTKVTAVGGSGLKRKWEEAGRSGDHYRPPNNWQQRGRRRY